MEAFPSSVPVKCETPRKRRKNKRAFAPITRYRDTTDFPGILSLKGDHMPGKRMVIKLTQDARHMLKTYVSQGYKNAREINPPAFYSSQTTAERLKISPRCSVSLKQRLSLSRLHHRLSGGQMHPEGMPGTAACHDQSTDALLPQAEPVFDTATALHTAVDLLDLQPAIAWQPRAAPSTRHGRCLRSRYRAMRGASYHKAG
jgi:hypothetical protein